MTTSFIDNYRFLASYNRCINQRLYAACDKLTDEQRKADLGAFFKSVYYTQTRHRGQAATLLLQATADVGVTDLIALV